MKASTSSICGAISSSELVAPGSSSVGTQRAPRMNNKRTRFQSRLPGGPEIESYAAVIIASIDATSVGLASDFDIGRWPLSVGRFPNRLKHFHRCIVPGNAANRSAAQRTRAAEKYIFIFRFDPPRASLFSCFGKRKRRSVLEDVAVVHPKRILDIDRRFAFDAGTAITRDCKTIFERFFQPLIHAFDELLFCEFAHLPVVARK